MKVKMGGDQEWKQAAVVDDTMVAALLLRLCQAVPPPSPPKTAVPLEWRVRQRRSKTVSINNSGKKPAVARASPTTPLSWSGATSVSGGCGGGSGSGGGGDGGSEESSKPPPNTKPETARSKLTSETTTGKRPRKKKTLSELKEEETLLLKERKHLKKELATVCVNLEKQQATSQNLKRMKLDFLQQTANERGKTNSTEEAILDQIPEISSFEKQNEAIRFALPDLNLPVEDDYSNEVLCRVS